MSGSTTVVERHRAPEAFKRTVGPLLRRDEARHNLFLGLLDTLIVQPDAYPEFRLWEVRRDGKPVAAALRTPPYDLVLARPEDEDALHELARAVAAEPETLPGVIGGVPEVEDFAEALAQTRGCCWRKEMAQGIYVLRAVERLPEPSGGPRSAGPGDGRAVIRFLRAFHDESGSPREWDEEAARRRMVPRLRGERDEGYFLWEDPEPVCLVGFTGPTGSGVRIGPVLTLPAARRRGYATALVAHASRRMLERGKGFCLLYTDLANPTSNAIYMKVGYRLVAESAVVRFE